ncbi:MAG: sulfatase-like hydrolase/transferase [Desulfobulbaceae bacterium]|nr:sulfatase-like hydrolase/transferase [Desulfobulbaceae bacterium]
MGFGEFGIPVLNQIRGYKTPNINKLGQEGAAFSRMYSEPSCTPTRAAFLTGRIPTRSHMFEAKIVPPEAGGLHRDEVTIAEVLSQAGYNTAHVGKWHQGDIEEAYPHNQGFDRAYFPMHNQATCSFMTQDAEDAGWGFNVAVRDNAPNYRLDDRFRPRGWVLGLEAIKGEQAHEWGSGRINEAG